MCYNLTSIGLHELCAKWRMDYCACGTGTETCLSRWLHLAFQLTGALVSDLNADEVVLGLLEESVAHISCGISGISLASTHYVLGVRG